MIKRRREIIQHPVSKIIYCYKYHQELFHELKAAEPDMIFTNRLEEVDDLLEPGTLVILDDLITDIKEGGKAHEIITRFFVSTSHHMNSSFWLLCQNPYHKGLRTISLNAQYCCFFATPRDKTIINQISRQIAPGQSDYVVQSFIRATTKKRHGHLFMNLDGRSTDSRYWLRSSVLPEDDVEIYVP